LFNRFDQIPAILIESDPTETMQFAIALWSVPFVCFIFFIFFGLGREQINQYKGWVYALLRPFGIKPPQPKPYSRDRRTWVQKLFRLRTPTEYGTGLSSSRGPADSVPVYRHGAAQVGSYGEKPIPSARSKNTQATLDTTMTLDYDQYDEKADVESDIVDSKHNTNKALPSSPTIVVNSIRESDGDGDGDEKYSRTTKISTSTASSVAGSSRRVSEAIGDVERSEAELRVIEARVQRMP